MAARNITVSFLRLSNINLLRHQSAISCNLKTPLRLLTTTAGLLSKAEPKIYTKTGDTGSSSLFTGERRPKDDVIFEALGTVDELSSHIGLAREFCLDTNDNELFIKLEDIQCILQDVASNIATPKTESSIKHQNRVKFDPSVDELEQWIDNYHNQLPPLRNFILPSGGKASAALHIARAVSRRLERTLVPLLNQSDLDANVFRYINRLSDFLFTAARWIAQTEGKPELVYKRKLKTVQKQ
eukprot:gene16709-18401_t